MSNSGRQEETSATGFFPNDLKKKRDEYTQDLRKGKREELLNDDRRRNLQNEQEMTDQEDLEELKKKENQLLYELRTEWNRQAFIAEDFGALIQKIESGDRKMQLYGLIGVSHLFQNSEIIQKQIEPDSMSQILRLVAKDDDYYALQREAICLIKRICWKRADLINALIESGGIPILFKLLKSSYRKIVLYTALIISVIASNSTSNRDIMLQQGALNIIFETMLKSSDPNLLNEGLQTVIALCKGKLPIQRFLEPAIPVLCSLYLAHQDEYIMALAARGLSWVANTTHAAGQIINMGVVPKLISHIDHHNVTLSRTCFWVIWRLFTIVPDSSFLDGYAPTIAAYLFQLTQSPNVRLKWEVCSFISTFTARSSHNAQIIIGNPYYVDMLLKLATLVEQGVAKCACQALSNAIKNIDTNMFGEALELGILECFIHHLQKTHSQIVLEPALEGILNVMSRAATIVAENGQKPASDSVLKMHEDKRVIELIKEIQLRRYPLSYSCNKNILLIHALYLQIRKN